MARGEKILVAVSGGVDSMVLLHALHGLAKKNRWKIAVAHFNHRLRGPASAADEKLVRRTAARLGLKYVAGGADVKAAAANAKISLEMAARKLRHEFLAQAARDLKISTVALAHHADDQVELFFLRLLRGAGGEGAAGMKWRSLSPAAKAVTLVRPLLDFSKAELTAFARATKMRFREDATNAGGDFLRNRIRNQLLPLLRRKYQPGVDQTVLRLMDIVGAESEVVSAAARNFGGSRRQEAQIKIGKGPLGRSGKPRGKNKLEPPDAGGCKFENLPLAVQRQVLQQELTGLGIAPDFELIERLRGTAAKRISICAGVSVMRDGEGRVGCLKEPAEDQANGFKAGELSVPLSGKQGRVQFAGRTFQWRIGWMQEFRRPPKKRAGGRAALAEIFDADPVGGEIILRHWRPGDRFQPIGLKSAVKLQDLFVNAKIPASRRRHLALATTATGEIFWVEGLRIGEQFKLTGRTRRKLSWRAGPSG